MNHTLRLTTLEPQFLKFIQPNLWRDVLTIQQADGIEFCCPLCMVKARFNRVGVHAIVCWRPSVPLTVAPGPGRWHLDGTNYHDLTLRGVRSDSIVLPGGCGAHFFVRNGAIAWA